jgi:sugar transferase (PEP-CTERM system associated)
MVRIFRHFVPASIMLLALCEIGLVFLACYFFFYNVTPTGLRVNDAAPYPALVVTIVAGGIMVLSGLYHNKLFDDFRIMTVQIVITYVFLCVLVAGWQFIIDNYFIDTTVASPRASLNQEVALTWLLCIICTRLAFARLLRLKIFTARVLVLGVGYKAARIASLAKTRNNRHFTPLAYLACGSETKMVAEPDPPELGPDGIVEYARSLGATEVVVAADDRRGLPLGDLLRCRTAGIRVTDYLDFIERQTKTVDLSALQPGWLVFSDGFRHSRGAEAIKRALDIVASFALLVFTLPLILLACLAVALDSPGPVLYRQVRIGRGGRPFTALKFRSMRADAEKDGAPRWAAARDPRVTRVGRVIRKLRIDELPQLINVLRGDMSFVGPRPERPAFVDELNRQLPFYAERHCVKPGITGWAQVNYPYAASFEDAREKLGYDLYYVKNHGLFLDLIIIAQTVRVILWADGAR